MSLFAESVVTGVLGTLAMDSLNHLFSRAGLITRIDVGAIGRMAAGWFRGRFRYCHPEEMAKAAHERLIGYLTHQAIGVAFALLYLLAWDGMVGGPASPGWAVPYGLATTVASWFIMYPSTGMGAFGRRSPNGPRALFSPLANHFFYGLGLAAGVGLL